MVLAFDGMGLQPSLQYLETTDEIFGFDNSVNGSKDKEMAKSLIVFMLRGISQRWNQPFAYYLTRNGLDPDALRTVLIEIAIMLHKHGINVRFCYVMVYPIVLFGFCFSLSFILLKVPIYYHA